MRLSTRGSYKRVRTQSIFSLALQKHSLFTILAYLIATIVRRALVVWPVGCSFAIFVQIDVGHFFKTSEVVWILPILERAATSSVYDEFLCEKTDVCLEVFSPFRSKVAVVETFPQFVEVAHAYTGLWRA